MSQFQPLNDNILVRINSAEKKTQSGIIIPDTASSSREVGEVVAVAPGGGETVAIGDKVMFRKNGITEIEENNEGTLVLVPFKDLLGKYADTDEI
ncbi:MAG TPA: co-chaperone GroES family protein [Balneolales bacterium]|nr:co-chaperone GroES family protein [Balneolales bacterium]